jgi:catechol 2,3-dioxygenase-like lactoylglutathione lyase family enzyme
MARGGDMNLERISAITINVNSMARSVHFYSRLLGLKVLYGGENAYFSFCRGFAWRGRAAETIAL